MLILACGLSMSGKTATIEAANTSGGKFFIHLKASELLARAGRPIADLRAGDVTENQLALVQKISGVIKHMTAPIVLDGHLLIETVDGPQLVPEAILDPLPIIGVIAIESFPSDIVARRRELGITATADDIADLATLESVQANRLARRQKAEFSMIRSGDTDALRSFVSRLVPAADDR